MSSDPPALEGETAEQPHTDHGLIGTIAIAFRWAYNNPVLGFGMDMLGIGTLVFVGVLAFMFAIVTIADFIGGWLTIYALFVLFGGGYGAYRKRHT